MTLVERLRVRLDDESAESFRLMGHDLLLLTGADLREASERYERALERVPAALREPFELEQAALMRQAHRFVRRYDRALSARIRGYLELGRIQRFAYPWPVVAILGLCQVTSGFTRMRAWGLLGAAMRRLRSPMLSEITDATEDVLRRTNRGIFVDSLPVVMLGWRAAELRRAGDAALADALLDGPLPLAMDDESRALARALDAALGLPDDAARFAALAALTRRHFAREQAIFTHAMGPRPDPRRTGPAWLRGVTAARVVSAPVVSSAGGVRRVEFRDYRLPRGFEMYDHDERVVHFGRAFVESVTASREDYLAAVDYVVGRFGERGERADAVYR